MARVLNKYIEEFLRNPSHNRDCVISYVKNSIEKGKESVALCFRGDYASLYYRCHQLLRIRRSKSAIIGEFDFRHSRFTKDFEEKLKLLESLGVDVSGFDKNKRSRRLIKFALDGKNVVKTEDIGKIFEIYKGLINDFLNPSLKEYQYDIPASSTDGVCRRKTKNVEKDRQQQLYSEYFYNTEETFYDLEYTEPNASKNGVAGRIDLLGIRRDGESYILELVELKSTLSACNNESGIAKHEIDYVNYADSLFIKDRKQDACFAMELLHELFGKPVFKGLFPENMKVSIKFIFTDFAKTRGNLYNPPEGIIKEVK